MAGASTHHYIEDAALLRAVTPAVPPEARPAVKAALERFLARQPSAPFLVGTTVAAEILGIRPPHVTRLREQGRMPQPVEIQGSVEAYIREEIEELAQVLGRERAEREARRAQREQEEAKTP